MVPGEGQVLDVGAGATSVVGEGTASGALTPITSLAPFRLGVFGGSFNPIHLGHLRMAEVAREAASLNRVLLIPTQVSPFKTGRQVTSATLRLEMLRAAVADNPYFDVSGFEVERAGPSYTVDTLRYLRAEFPRVELFFLTGTDAMRDLPAWREPQEVLALARFLVLTRPGASERDVLDALPDPWEARITFITMPGLDISSSYLREQVGAGRSVRYLVPPTVDDFIARQGLYRADIPSGFVGE